MLLAINATMFCLEIVSGILANSTALLADSLDMLADAAIYGITLYAVGKSDSAKRKAAAISLVVLYGSFEIVRDVAAEKLSEAGTKRHGA
jgi:Co/Zn/Cd efflux system component